MRGNLHKGGVDWEEENQWGVFGVSFSGLASLDALSARDSKSSSFMGKSFREWIKETSNPLMDALVPIS